MLKPIFECKPYKTVLTFSLISQSRCPGKFLYILQFQGVTKKTFIPKKLENIVKLFKSKLN